MSENDKFNIVVLKDMGVKDSVDKIEVKAETVGNEMEQDHSGNLSKYDPSLDIPIALKKDTRSCTKHLICNYVSYESLSPQFRAFTTGRDYTMIAKSIYIALECPK